MARFRSREARLKELEGEKRWLREPNIDWRRLSPKQFDEYLVYIWTGEVGKKLSKDISSGDMKEVIGLYKAGEHEQAKELLKQFIVDIDS